MENTQIAVTNKQLGAHPGAAPEKSCRVVDAIGLGKLRSTATDIEVLEGRRNRRSRLVPTSWARAYGS